MVYKLPFLHVSPTMAAAGNLYTINGFFMAMREAYTKDGASIHYFVVEWEQAALNWADFRGKVLGATDPTTAVDGSVRKQILTDWKALGLTAEPNVGNNGVHASASPFEGMCERMNWVGASADEDPFFQALLKAGVPKDTIMSWTKDPQVAWEGGKASLFDLFEDINATESLEKATKIAGVSGDTSTPITNQAFVFIKPHAVTEAVVALVKDKLGVAGIKILSEGAIDSKKIAADMLIDNHYYAIANKATLTKPADLNPPAAGQAEFEKLFGISWTAALEQGLVLNAIDACTKLGCTGDEMDAKWAACKKAGKLVKFGGGFYAGQIA